MFRGLAVLRSGFLVHTVGGQGLFLHLDDRGQVISRLGQALTISGIPPGVAGVVNQQAFAVRPSDGRIAAAGVRTGTLRFYGADGLLLDTVITPVRFEPQFRIGGDQEIPSMIPDTNDRFAYLDLAASDRQVLALFSGVRRGSGNVVLSGRDIQVFDWNGCLSQVFRLEKGIGYFVVDWTNRILYGSRMGADPAVISVQLPDLKACPPPT